MAAPVSTRQQVLDLLNEQNNSFFTFDHISFGVPGPAEVNASRNTTMIISSLNTSSFRGQVTVGYNRLDLNVMFAAVDCQFLYDESISSTHDLIPLLNERFELGMTVEDIINDPIDLGEGVFPLVPLLRAQPDSYGYFGEVEFYLVEEIVGQTIYNASIGELFVNANSETENMLVTDYVDGSFVRYTSDDLMLAVRPVYWTSATDYTTPASDSMGNYEVVVQNYDQWYIEIAARGENLRTLAESSRVQLRITGPGITAIYCNIAYDDYYSAYVVDLPESTWNDRGPYRGLETAGTPDDQQSFVFNIRMRQSDLAPNADGEMTNEDGYLLSELQFTLQILDTDESTPIHSVSCDVTSTLDSTVEEPNFVESVSYELRGENGSLYFIAPSAVGMMANDTFPSANLSGDTGYAFGPASKARLVDSNLEIDLNVSGFVSQYAGNLQEITLYGCDSETGEIMETYTLADAVWDYSTGVDLPDVPVLDPTLIWRGSLRLDIEQTTGGTEVFTDVIDFLVLKSESFQLVSIGESTVDAPFTIYNYNNGDEIPGVFYTVDHGAVELLYGETYEAIINVRGVDTPFSFTMTGW